MTFVVLMVVMDTLILLWVSSTQPTKASSINQVITKTDISREMKQEVGLSMLSQYYFGLSPPSRVITVSPLLNIHRQNPAIHNLEHSNPDNQF